MTEKSTSSLPVAGDGVVLASRYVAALFSLAEQEGAVDATVADLAALRELWAASPDWRFVATDPRLNYEAVCKVARDVAKEAGVGDLTARFLAVVAQNRRLALLPVLIEKFMDEVSVKRGEHVANVRVARALTEAQSQKLASLLASAMGGQVRLEVEEDETILGGLTVKVGSRYIDASVKTKLDRLERALKETNAAA